MWELVRPDPASLVLRIPSDGAQSWFNAPAWIGELPVKAARSDTDDLSNPFFKGWRTPHGDPLWDCSPATPASRSAADPCRRLLAARAGTMNAYLVEDELNSLAVSTMGTMRCW